MIEVRIGGRRRIDRVLAPGFATELDRLPLTDLRQRRNDAAQEETDLSYLRRLLHARIDIVKAEQRRRSSGDQGSLVDQLKHILADESVGRRGRHQPLEPSRTTERSRRQIDALVSDAGLSDVGARSDDELTESLRRYTERKPRCPSSAARCRTSWTPSTPRSPPGTPRAPPRSTSCWPNNATRTNPQATVSCVQLKRSRAASSPQ